jgi:EPS-associated MarR family transcriptional regulator
MPTAPNDLITEREETDFRVLRALGNDPHLSQREIAQRVGISLGAVNYCLKALVDKGLVKVQNFRASNNKLRYAYVLTPQGMGERLHLAREFLDRKLKEYERLKEEIEDVARVIGEGD